MAFLKRWKMLAHQHTPAVKIGKVSSSSSHCHYFITGGFYP